MIIHYISLLVLTTVQPREERGWNNRRTMATQESFILIGGEQLVTMQCAVMAVVCNKQLYCFKYVILKYAKRKYL